MAFTTNLYLEKPAEGTIPFDDALNTNMDIIDRLMTCSADVAGLTCTGATPGWKWLHVKRDSTGNITVSSAGLAVGKADMLFSSDLTVAGSSTLSYLRADDTIISGTLDVTGSADFAADVSVGGTLLVSGNITGLADIHIAGSGTFTGIACTGDIEATNARLSGTLDVAGSADFAAAVSIGTTLQVSGTLTALADVNVGDDLTVTGSATLNDGANIVGEGRMDTLRLDANVTSGFGSVLSSTTPTIAINMNGTIYYVPATTTLA